MTTWKLEHNDVIEWAKGYTGEPFMACLCDPPYHLTTPQRFGKPGSAPAKVGVYNRASRGMMGQLWDGGDVAFDPATWAALSQHLYPGAFIMAFGGSRGYHRMATAMEDAGLIIHPALGWLTLSGFPKATRIDTQIDKAAGAEQEIIDSYEREGRSAGIMGKKVKITRNITAPATPLARDWAGHRYGLQALKPAFEFIAVAQVPYEGRPVDSIVATGAGALNIDGGRIGTAKEKGWPTSRSYAPGQIQPGGKGQTQIVLPAESGRWPANFVLTHHVSCNGDCHPDCPVRLFDEQAGESRSAYGNEESAIKNAGKDVNPGSFGGSKSGFSYTDSGPASRMFHRSDWAYEVAEQLANAEPVRYEPKSSRVERDAGLEGFEREPTRWQREESGVLAQGKNPKTGERTGNLITPAMNSHPTVKPLSLVKYLATLLAPPAAYAPRRILIPFAGSGSEIIGAILSGGFEEIIGIERESGYVKIAQARCEWWSQWPGWGQTDVDPILAAAKVDDVGQMSLFHTAA